MSSRVKQLQFFSYRRCLFQALRMQKCNNKNYGCKKVTENVLNLVISQLIFNSKSSPKSATAQQENGQKFKEEKLFPSAMQFLKQHYPVSSKSIVFEEQKTLLPFMLWKQHEKSKDKYVSAVSAIRNIFQTSPLRTCSPTAEHI